MPKDNSKQRNPDIFQTREVIDWEPTMQLDAVWRKQSIILPSRSNGRRSYISWACIALTNH